MFPSAPVQQGSLERRVVGEENNSELITLGTDPEKGKEKKKNKTNQDLRKEKKERSPLTHREKVWDQPQLLSFFYPVRKEVKVEIQGGGRAG